MTDGSPLQRRAERRAQETGGKHERTPQKLISQLIDRYVSAEERRARFLLDAAAAWEAYRARGLRATSREVLAWLETWIDGDDSEGPSCHR